MQASRQALSRVADQAEVHRTGTADHTQDSIKAGSWKGHKVNN